MVVDAFAERRNKHLFPVCVSAAPPHCTDCTAAWLQRAPLLCISAQLLVQACLAGSRQECNLSGQNRGKGQRPRQHRADPRKATAKLLVRGRLRWLTEAEMDEVSTQRRPKGILKEQHQRPTSRRPVRPKQPHQDPLRKWSQSGPKQSLEQLVCGRTVIRPQSIPTTRCTLSLKFELNSCLLGCG
ncbi:uncharacterized protein LOC121895364 isoform X5 [Thunnus maccoyii]|uniref:uncharacterized protein LOC121895364 isoform X5 n=1 Tax=Thunnus maccoyii TaxID=8240 RepID=UPI001C4C6DDE|nr:uncharacterized protein LOC121895364 isoform X5 [Thunnus maccoyii]